MASIHKEFRVPAAPAQVWKVVADFGAVDQLARGFVTQSQPAEDGAVRKVTFFNGMTVQERLVTSDAQAMRLVYTAEGGRATHHNAVVQLLPDGDGTRFVWTTDLLPDALAPAITQMMDAGAAAMQKALAELAA